MKLHTLEQLWDGDSHAISEAFQNWRDVGVIILCYAEFHVRRIDVMVQDRQLL